MKGVDTIARIRRDFFIGGKPIKEIVRQLHVSRNTVRKVLRSGASAFIYAREVQPLPRLGRWRADLERLLAANAAKPARSPTETIRFLTLDEFARLLAVMRGHLRDRALFLIACHRGLRAGEVGLVRLDDHDFRALRLRVHRLKGSHSGVHRRNRVRPRPCGPTSASGPRRRPPILFPSNRGGPIARRTLDWLMKRHSAAADLPPVKRHFHCLKHSIATHLLEAGADLRFVQDWFGHSNIQRVV